MRPVADVMGVGERKSAAGEPATSVSMLQRAPKRRRNCPRPRADLRYLTVCVVPHHYPGRIAGQTARGLCGNVRAGLEQ